MPRYSLESLIAVLLVLWLLGWLVIPVAGGSSTCSWCWS